MTTSATVPTTSATSDPAASADPLGDLGLRVVPMVPGLAPALVRFHEGLSPATTRSRFFAVHPHLSAAEVTRFTTVDHRRRDALVVLDGEDEIVAVGRFDVIPGATRAAEVALVVTDRWQHRGVGAALFARLVARARELGIEQLRAETLAGNRAMRAVFRHAGHAVTERTEDGVVGVTIELVRR